MSHTIKSFRPWFAAKLARAVGESKVVKAGTDGLTEGTIQETVQALASRIKGLES